MKKNLGILGFFIILITLMNFVVSELYTSITKVDYIEGNKTLKFTTKVNTNHISNTLKISPNTTDFEAEVRKYISKNFNIFINGDNKNLVFTGNQISGEYVWIYFETPNVENISNLKIKNSILLESYPKQLNMVNISYKGNQRNFYAKSDEKFSLDFVLPLINRYTTTRLSEH